MGYVFNSGMGGWICDNCNVLMADGAQNRLRTTMQGAFWIKTKYNDTLGFCSEKCVKRYYEQREEKMPDGELQPYRPTGSKGNRRLYHLLMQRSLCRVGSRGQQGD